MAKLICPNCGSAKLDRSHAHGLRETLLKSLKRRPFRCEDCGWRGMMKAKSEKGGRVSRRKSYAFVIVFSLIVLFLLIIINVRPDIVEKIARSLIGPVK